MLINHLHLKLYLKGNLRKLNLEKFCCIIYEYCSLEVINLSLSLSFFPSELIKKTPKHKTKQQNLLMKLLKCSSYTSKMFVSLFLNNP